MYTGRKQFDEKELKRIDRNLQKAITEKFGADVQITINHNTEAASGDVIEIASEAYGVKKTEKE